MARSPNLDLSLSSIFSAPLYEVPSRNISERYFVPVPSSIDYEAGYPTAVLTKIPPPPPKPPHIKPAHKPPIYHDTAQFVSVSDTGTILRKSIPIPEPQRTQSTSPRPREDVLIDSAAAREPRPLPPVPPARTHAQSPPSAQFKNRNRSLRMALVGQSQLGGQAVESGTSSEGISLCHDDDHEIGQVQFTYPGQESRARTGANSVPPIPLFTTSEKETSSVSPGPSGIISTRRREVAPIRGAVDSHRTGRLQTSAQETHSTGRRSGTSTPKRIHFEGDEVISQVTWLPDPERQKRARSMPALNGSGEIAEPPSQSSKEESSNYGTLPRRQASNPSINSIVMKVRRFQISMTPETTV